MKMQKISFVSILFSLIACREFDYNIKELYTVNVSTQNADLTFTPAVPISDSTLGFCFKCFPEEDLLVISYNTPNNGIRPITRLSIESIETAVPTLMSLIAPNEIKQNVSVTQTTNPTTGFSRFSLDILIPSSTADGKIKIRFLSSVDITPLGDPASNTYTLSSEYFIKNDTDITVNGYPLNTVGTPCNSVVWYKRVFHYMCEVFKRQCISEGELICLADIYRSEITRNSEVFKSRIANVITSRKRKCDSESDSSSCYESEESNKCNVQNEVVCESSVQCLTPESIYKSAAICTLFNVYEKCGYTHNVYNELTRLILELKVDIKIDVILALLENFVNNCDYDDSYIQGCKIYKQELEIQDVTYDSICGAYNNNLSEDECDIIGALCNEDISISMRDKSLKSSTTATIKSKKCIKAKTISKKSSKNNDESSSSSNEEGDNNEGSGVGKVVIAVTVVAVIVVCAVGVSYLL